MLGPCCSGGAVLNDSRGGDADVGASSCAAAGGGGGLASGFGGGSMGDVGDKYCKEQEDWTGEDEYVEI